MNNTFPLNLIFIVLISGICLTSAANLDGEIPDSIPSYRMSEIVVFANRALAVRIPTLYEIDREQIESFDVRDPQQALNFSPGIYISRTERNEASLRLRGFEQRQISVFYDGVPISLPFDGVVDISQLSGDNLENIRISRGVSSVLYGANTLGGTVNLISEIPDEEQQYHIRGEGTDNGRFFSALQYGNSIYKLRYIISFKLENSPDLRLPSGFKSDSNEDGGKRDNSDFRKSSLSVKLHYQPVATHQFGIQFNNIDNRFNVPPKMFVNRPRYWKFPEWKKNVFSLNSRHIFSPAFLLRTTWYFDRYRNVLESYDDASYSTQTKRYAFSSIYDDYSLGTTIYPQFSLFPFGTTNGLISYKQDIHRQKSEESDPFQRFSMETWTFGAEQDLDISKQWSAVLGADVNHLRPLSAEDLTLRDPISLFNAQAAFRYRISGDGELHFSGGKKSRFPTLKELYSERLGRNIPNPELKSEHAYNFETGYGWQKDGGQVQLSLFHNRLRNLITNRQLGGNTQQLQNIGKALLQGFEIYFRIEVESAALGSNYLFLDSKNRSENRDSDHLEYRPQHNLNGWFNYFLTRRILIRLEGSYTAYQYYQHPDSREWNRLNDFGLVNGKINIKFSKILSFYLRANNITDKFYFSEYGVPMQGREFIAGFKLGN